MFRAAVSGLCVAQVFGTGEHGALMQSQANTEDLDAILLANADSSEKPKFAKHHAHGSHERSRQKMTELQSNAQMLEQKYRAILHAKVEKTASASSASTVIHGVKRGAHEWVPAEDLFDPVDDLLKSMEDTLLDEKKLNQNLIEDAKDVLNACNNKRRDEFDLPRYMDYYYYAKTIKHICSNFNTCFDAAQSDWDALRENTEILEKSQKLIWKVMEKARCYVDKIRKNTPSKADIQTCVDLDPSTSILDITYDPEVVKDVCDICSVQVENAEEVWEERHHRSQKKALSMQLRSCLKCWKRKDSPTNRLSSRRRCTEPTARLQTATLSSGQHGSRRTQISSEMTCAMLVMITICAAQMKSFT